MFSRCVRECRRRSLRCNVNTFTALFQHRHPPERAAFSETDARRSSLRETVCFHFFYAPRGNGVMLRGCAELRENICVRCRRKCCCCCVAAQVFLSRMINTRSAAFEEFNRSYNVYIIKEIEIMTLPLCMILVIIICCYTSEAFHL